MLLFTRSSVLLYSHDCLFVKYLNLPLHILATLSQYLSKGQIKGLSLQKTKETKIIKGDDMKLNLLINS